MLRLVMVAALWLLVSVRVVTAQAEDVVWVQIEAQPTLAQAQASARTYAATLEDVNGFAIGGGWYAVVLGPYRREDAEQVLRVYRTEGSIPRDSFIAFTTSFRQQFWPVGASTLPSPEPQSPEVQASADLAPAAAAPETTAEATPAPDETEREARASEASLTRAEREALQVALKWSGHYDGGIDGAFGRGTRSAMASWQGANGYPATGVMTTLQRAALLGAFNAILDGLDLASVRDEQAGIEILMPTATVAFTKYEPPFAHYDATGDIPARVLLISQEGDQTTLFGLYDLLQTLEIVPPEGPRSRDNSSFVIVGQGRDFVSHTEARLQNGEIKGFSLIWPAGDEERRTRLLAEMQASFTRLPGTIDPAMVTSGGQSIDLVAGLAIRKPVWTRSGVFVDAKGAVATSAEAVEGCGRVTLDGAVEASVAASDPALGIALLRPATALAPRGVAAFRLEDGRLNTEIAVSGYPYGAVLDRAVLTFGRLADVTGLNGDADLSRLDLKPLPEDGGGPVIDSTGAVLGLLVPVQMAGQQLPDTVAFAREGAAVARFLAAQGITVARADAGAQLTPEDLSRRTVDMTVLVSCWKD